jgi:hypothetical protein
VQSISAEGTKKVSDIKKNILELQTDIDGSVNRIKGTASQLDRGNSLWTMP